MSSNTPYLALVVEDSEGHGALAEELLAEYGFNVTWVRTLLDAVPWLKTHLAIPHQYPPLVLVDVMLPNHYHPRLEGSVLVTWLTDAIQSGDLHPARIIGISNQLTPQREWEARAAGCEIAIAKPLLPSTAAMIHTFFLDQSTYQPPQIEDIAVQAFRQQQRDVMELLFRARDLGTQARVWTIPEIRAVLGSLFSAIHLTAEDHAHGERLLRELGGKARAQTILHQCAQNLGATRIPLVLQMMKGVTQQALAVQRGLTWKTLQPLLEQEYIALAAMLSRGELRS